MQLYLEVGVLGVSHLIPAGRGHDVALLVSRQEPEREGLNPGGVQAGHPMQVLTELRHSQQQACTMYISLRSEQGWMASILVGWPFGAGTC